MSVKSTRFVSYKFIDSMGHLREKVVSTGRRKLESTCFDGSSFGFAPTYKSDLILEPDNDSVHFDPVRNMDGVFCNLKYPGGKELEEDFRTSAYNATREDKQTLGSKFGVEPEFYICTNEGGTLLPAGISSPEELMDVKQYKWYGCLPPVDVTQDVRHTIAEYLDKAGFEVEAYHHEVGPGQCEFSWRYDSLVRTADNMMLFKYIVAYVCNLHGYVADFRAKPFSNLNGNGCHVHQSVPKMNWAVLPEDRDPNFPEVVTDTKSLELYARGLVEHYDELLEVCCVGETSSLRLVPGFEAPTKDNNGWGWFDRTKTVRIPAGGRRVEFRLPDPEMNPYKALPLMLKFGYESIKRG